MFSSISHEFRTPLNSFQNVISLLEIKLKQIEQVVDHINLPLSHSRKVSEGFNSCEKFLKMGNISSKILENLVEDVLDFAKIEVGTFRLNPQPFKISDLVDELSYIFQIQ